MTWGWQDVATWALVLAALAYLARDVVRRTARKSAGGCATGGCGTCPLNPAVGPGARRDKPDRRS